MFDWLKSIGLIPKSEPPRADAEPPAATAQPAEPPPEQAGLADRQPGLMATVSGRLFDVLNPLPEQVSLSEIAHGLSQLCRFNGHTKFPYSVAQHSVYVARECLRRYPEYYETALACLLHDAAEAYVGDVIRPIKVLIAPIYAAIENRVQAAIWAHFQIEPTAATAAVV